MRAHHIVDVVRCEPGSRKALLEAVAVHHVPERPRRPRLVIADTGIDQDIVVRRLYDEALHAQHQAAADRIDESRLQPGAVLLKKFFGERREKFHHVKERPLLLDHRVNRDVLERDCSRHLGAFLGLSGRQCEHPKLLCWSPTIARRQLAAALRHLRLAYVGFGSFATGSGRPPLRPCPLCPESDGRPPKCDRSRWAKSRHRTRSWNSFLEEVNIGWTVLAASPRVLAAPYAEYSLTLRVDENRFHGFSALHV